MTYRPWSLFGQDHDPEAAREAIRAVKTARTRLCDEYDIERFAVYGSLRDPHLPFTPTSDIDLLIEGVEDYEQQKALRSAGRSIGDEYNKRFQFSFEPPNEVNNPSMVQQLQGQKPDRHPLILTAQSTLLSAYRGMRQARERFRQATIPAGEKRVIEEEDEDRGDVSAALLTILQRSICFTPNAAFERLLSKLDGREFMTAPDIEDTDGVRAHIKDLKQPHPNIRPAVLTDETTRALQPHLERLNERLIEPDFEVVRELYQTLPEPLRLIVRDINKHLDFLQTHLDEWPMFEPTYEPD